MDRTAGFAEEEAGASGLHHARTQDQRHLPGFGEEVVVDREVLVRQKNLAARMRVIPAYRHEAGKVDRRGDDEITQFGFVVPGKDEGWPVRMFAIEGRVPRNAEKPVLPLAHEHAADFRTAARQGAKGVHNGKPYIVEHTRRVLDREGTTRRLTGS